jgi:hypothetical protein
VNHARAFLSRRQRLRAFPADLRERSAGGATSGTYADRAIAFGARHALSPRTTGRTFAPSTDASTALHPSAPRRYENRAAERNE